MLVNDIFVSAYKQNLGMVKMHLADLSDADLLVRPVAGANHANWQLGHLVRAETGILSSIGAKMPELPASFMEKYEQKKANVDGAENFVSKEELLSRFEAARNAAIEFAQSASEEFMKQEAPEKMRRMCATNGDMLGLILGHTAMHVGQIQVLRRKLGKPILFLALRFHARL